MTAMATETRAFHLTIPQAQPRLRLTGQAATPAALTEKYRPCLLAEMVGQGEAVYRLLDFLEAPHSGAFLLEGPTGVGKTTAALCLAAELGAVEFGGLERINSGMQDAEAVEAALAGLRYTPMLGSGWKVVVVDEADYMSQKAQQLWLSALEDLPPRSVVVFTTNRADKFPDRFLDRCERLAFRADAPMLLQDAQALVDDVWRREGRPDSPPDVAGLEGIVDGEGRLSFRRVLRALEPMLRRPVAPRVAEAPAVIEATEEGEGREPCLDCGTRHGGRTSTGKIERTKGRCQSCYNKHRRVARGAV